MSPWCPEPASLTFFGVGLTALLGAHRRGAAGQEYLNTLKLVKAEPRPATFRAAPAPPLTSPVSYGSAADNASLTSRHRAGRDP